MNRNQRNSFPITARSTTLNNNNGGNTQYQPVSAKSFTPSDEAFQAPPIAQSASSPASGGYRAITYGNWNPTGYTTASSQASRLAKSNGRPGPQQMRWASQSTSNLIPPRAITGPTHASHQSNTSSAKPQNSTLPSISLGKVGAAQKALHSLQAGFTFPEHLDFLDRSDASDGSSLGYLSFSTNNRHVREHREALIRIQTNLDAIPSHGNETVRKMRKEVVDQVEHALHELEDGIRRRHEEWRRSTQTQEHSREAPPSDMPPMQALSVQTPPMQTYPVQTHPPNPPPPVPPKSFTVKKKPLQGPPPSDTYSAFPMPPVPTPDVCRLVGADHRFQAEYKNMSEKFVRIQLQRIQAVAHNQSTTQFDQALAVLDKNWKEFLHTLILVSRNEERIGRDLLRSFDSDSELDSSSAESDSEGIQTNYLRLAIDPYDNDKKRSFR